MSRPTPKRFGRYEIIRALRSGGMADLYLARDPNIGDRLVVIKVLRDAVDTPEIRKRFKSEANLLGVMNHINIVGVFDVGHEDNRSFIAMEYIDGETLGDLIARQPDLPLSRKLQLLEELCAGLDCAHRKGVVHRDVKPPNIMIDQAGVLKILDFGIARISSSNATQTGALMGTLNYMAPEQILGERVDARADMFAGGAVFYELLSYQRAFPGQWPEIIPRIAQALHEPLARAVPGLDAELVAVVERCLSRLPDDRYKDMGAVLRTLRAIRLRVKQDEEQRCQQHLDAARQAMNRGDLQAAHQECVKGLNIQGDWEGLLEFQAELSARAERVEIYVAEARKRLDAGAPTEAEALVNSALALNASSPQGLEIQEAIDAERKRRAEAKARAEELARAAVIEARKLFSAGRMGDALGRLEAYRPVNEIVTAALADLQREAQAIADREAAARRTVDRGWQRFRSGDIGGALRLVEAHRPEHPTVTAALLEMRAEAKKQEEEARRWQDEMRRQTEATVILGPSDATAAAPPGPADPSEKPRLQGSTDSLPRRPWKLAATAGVAVVLLSGTVFVLQRSRSSTPSATGSIPGASTTALTPPNSAGSAALTASVPVTVPPAGTPGFPPAGANPSPTVPATVPAESPAGSAPASAFPPASGSTRSSTPAGPLAALPADADGDGVPDKADRCPATPARIRVDPTGCVPPPVSPVKGEVWTAPQDQLPMVWLEARRVQVGSDPSDISRGETEVARRTVEFGKGFWLDQYEVTNDKFREFVLAVPEWQKGPGDPKLRHADYLNRWNGPASFAAGIGRQPVTYVSFHAAAAYCGWAGKRLPKEDEWEYAARAGTLTAYWWGGEMDSTHANDGDSLKSVGDPETRNPWGFFDILGNALEWTQEGWLRGGSIKRRPASLRSASRIQQSDLAFANIDYGFRCAR